jgi:hypothetical protein
MYAGDEARTDVTWKKKSDGIIEQTVEAAEEAFAAIAC